MILSSLVFDVLLYGLMALAVAFDALTPATHGAATLIVLGFILFLAAEDAAHHARRVGWGQESLASGIAVSVYGFIYFWWRNSSDAAATALHICLMLSALMVLIGVVSALGTAFKERSGGPVLGLIVTKLSAALLGAGAGMALLFWSSAAPLPFKLAAVAGGLVLWRLLPQKQTAVSSSPEDAEKLAALAAPRVLRPAHGTALGRALPLILLGALGALMTR